MEICGTGAIKGLLRRELNRLAEEWTPEQKRESDEDLISQFLALPAVERAESIMLYWGVGVEPDTRPLLENLLAAGKKVCLPRCLPENRMEARKIERMDQVRPGLFHIPEPDDTCAVISRDDLDLVLAPCICCDLAGFRLGHGAGYYDRYLAGYRGTTVCLCREEFLQDHLPREPYDLPADIVLTEYGRAGREE